MSTLILAAAKVTGCYQPIVTSVNTRHRPSFSRPFSSTSFRTPIRACVENSNHRIRDKSGELFKIQINPQNPTPGVSVIPIWSPLRATLVATVTAAFLFSRFYFNLKPAVAAPILPPSTVETSTNDAVSDEEREKSLEENLRSNPSDIDSLTNLMEIKITTKKVPEAITILDKLIELDPEDIEWPMLKAHLYAYSGDTELAKNVFNGLLIKDPFRVDAYHGLVTVASQEDSTEELESIERKVEEAMELCEKENKKSESRDFRLLLAQIQVVDGRYDTALKVYQELVTEEPKDFRPYLCQGIIYSLLRKNNEAEKSFETYRKLVPEGHPYASYFDSNMIATKIFAQKMENERAVAKS